MSRAEVQGPGDCKDAPDGDKERRLAGQRSQRASAQSNQMLRSRAWSDRLVRCIQGSNSISYRAPPFRRWRLAEVSVAQRIHHSLRTIDVRSDVQHAARRTQHAVAMQLCCLRACTSTSPRGHTLAPSCPMPHAPGGQRLTLPSAAARGNVLRQSARAHAQIIKL